MLDPIKAKALQIGINKLIKEYGQVKLYDCDFGNGVINGHADLEGEEESISFTLKYKLIRDDVGDRVKIKSLKLSREWMQKLAKDYIKNQEIEVDGWWGDIIDLL